MKKNVLATLMLTAMFIARGQAVPISIYDVQYTTDVSGDSPYANQVVDCTGGIVIHKWIGGSTKLTLWDPAHASGWGGIIAKAFAGEFDGIQVGDWVSFTNVLVEERSGNTQLSFETGAGVNIDSSGNMLPEALEMTVPSFSEQYESMNVKISNVTITAKDLGRYSDNYNMHNSNGDYWGADYMNGDAGGLYHPLVNVGNTFENVSGIIEHKISSGWDYYQLLTTRTSDFVVPEPTTVVLLASGTILLRRRRKA